MTGAAQPAAGLLHQCSSWWQGLARFRRGQLIVLVVAALLVVLAGSRQYSSAELTLNVELPAAGSLQVFFDQGNGFSEAGSVTRELPAGSSHLQLQLPPGRTFTLRLDPPTSASTVAVRDVRIEGSMPSAATSLVPTHLNELVPIEASGQDGRYQLLPGAGDPQLVVALPTPAENASRLQHRLARLAWVGLGLCLAIAMGLQMAHTGGYAWPSLICASLVLALAGFATLSPSVSPDEDLHEAGARYFSTHWLPPALDSPEMLPSYQASPYGVSYLAEWNVTYLFAGKASNVAAKAGLTERQGFRLYQASILLLLIAAVFLLRLSPFTLVPVLVTPQAWYVFSYMNGDALPLAAASLAAGIALTRESPLRSYLLGERHAERVVIVHALLFALCLGLLIISKRNYWPIAVFIATALASAGLRLPVRSSLAIAIVCTSGILWAAAGHALHQAYALGWLLALLSAASMMILAYDGWRLVRSRMLAPACRLGALFALALALAAPWIAVDVLRNGSGSQKAELVDHLREVHAAPGFKPGDAAPSPGLRLYEQGYSLPQMLRPPLLWQVGTAKSLFGVYGYMQYYAPLAYYQAIWGLTTLLVLLALCTAATSQPLQLGRSQLVLAVGAAVSLLGASLLHSWTYDFQAQGRYVLGICVLLGAQLSHLRPGSQLERLAHHAVAAAVVLGACSFLWIALPNLTP
ncbi:MAG TPA: hypothetical protein DIV57_17255 [Stenotrophomonas sp.]|uniref:hypothetical protein n=1 Tax=Stenotrophomonas sp. SPM TaxID=2170735 RepID=UPI000DE6A1F3|nr:hypothetical protein [Stenotrophomonas sp. SPM]PWB27590.1 hypothetical protein DCO49_07095 [Stenotrophomonas sp. SPM]HCR35105.1 hypothetical protein [Stenotrophomonas sp.]